MRRRSRGSIGLIGFLSVFALVMAALVAACSAEGDGNNGTTGPGSGADPGNGTDPGGGTDPGTGPGSVGPGTGPGTGQAGTPGSGAAGQTSGGAGNTGAAGIGPTQPYVQPDDPNAPKQLDFSYIWIANAAQSTVSKVNTRTMEEEGRYLTRADSAGNPSRTSVNVAGDVAVANRKGGVIKILAKECPDRNGDGTVQTSTGASDILPWGEDECVAWYWDAQFFSQRPVAWAPPGLEDESAGNVWVSGTDYPCDFASCQIDVMRLNGDTGELMDRITVTGLGGPTRIGMIDAVIPAGGLVVNLTGYGGYGGASDAQGHFWIFVTNTTQLVRVDAVTLEYHIWDIPSFNGYGITIDHLGRIFLCGALGVSRFDPTDQTWQENLPGPLIRGWNGCMTDGAQTLWVGGGVDFGLAGLYAYDIESLAEIGAHQVGAVKGVSIDYDGYVWGVSGVGSLIPTVEGGNVAYRLDPANGDVQTYNGLSGAYTYSDMTGFGLKSAGVIVPVIE